MKKFMSFGLVLAFGVVLLGSCGKYEEGPSMSLRSKKGRLANTWVVEKTITTTTVDGVSTTNESTPDADDTFEFTIEKDGTWSQTDGTTTITGTWEFSGDTDLKAKVDNVDGETVSTILKLKNKELWTSDTFEFTFFDVTTTTVTETHFKPKG